MDQNLNNLVKKVMIEAIEKSHSLEMIPGSRLFDLTESRYHIFRNIFRHSLPLNKVYDRFQSKYSSYSNEFLLDIIADLVYCILQKKSKNNEELNNHIITEVKNIVAKLDRKNWFVHGSFLINNLTWENEDEEGSFKCMGNRIEIIKNTEFISGHDQKDIEEIEYSGIFNYLVDVCENNYDNLYKLNIADEMILVFIMGLRLIHSGDIGTNMFEAKLLDNYRIKRGYLDLLPHINYQNKQYIIKKGEEPFYYGFCTQLYRSWDNLKKIKKISIITNNFIESYNRNYMDRGEIYYRVIQAIFRKGRRPQDNIDATFKLITFLGMNKIHKELPKNIDFFKETYAERGGITHGAEDFTKIPPMNTFNYNSILEEYCRQAIFYQICFTLNDKNNYLENFDVDIPSEELYNIKKDIQKKFWKDSPVNIVYGKSEEFPYIWI